MTSANTADAESVQCELSKSQCWAAAGSHRHYKPSVGIAAEQICKRTACCVLFKSATIATYSVAPQMVLQLTGAMHELTENCTWQRGCEGQASSAVDRHWQARTR